MPPSVSLYRWDELALEKVTEMISRKIVTGEREMLAQIYLKKGALVPMHNHESEQITYVLQGALKFLISGEEITVREGEVLHIPSWVEHQAEALDDTFELDLFAPIRQDWLDHTDAYFHRKVSWSARSPSFARPARAWAARRPKRWRATACAWRFAPAAATRWPRPPSSSRRPAARSCRSRRTSARSEDVTRVDRDDRRDVRRPRHPRHQHRRPAVGPVHDARRERLDRRDRLACS